jgi:two-component system cell cycle response regulator
VTYRVTGYDGITRWMHSRIRPHRTNGRLFMDGITSDVTARKETEDALRAAQVELRRQLAINEYQALHDALTGLPNRRRLLIDLEGAVATASGALLLCDLDGFKAYNDNFGHPAGDALLQRLTHRLESAVKEVGSAYRLGGDEFCVVAPHSQVDVTAVVEKVKLALSEVGEGFTISASCGFSLLGSEARTVDAALGLADRRMYEAKQSGRPSPSTLIADVLARALCERDPSRRQHLFAVASLCEHVAERLALTPSQVETIRQAAQLRDIGMLAVPDTILRKRAPLGTDEWRLFRQHPAIGERIVGTVPSLGAVARIIRSSHEWVDGNGYPDGLVGDAIPLGSRIIAACEAVEEKMSVREANDHVIDDVLHQLQMRVGTALDRDVVAALSAVVRESHPWDAIQAALT